MTAEDAVRELTETLCGLAGVTAKSSAADGRRDIFLVEVDLGGRSYWAALPLEEVCRRPTQAAWLLAGCCAAKAIEWFFEAPKPLIEVIRA